MRLAYMEKLDFNLELHEIVYMKFQACIYDIILTLST